MYSRQDLIVKVVLRSLRLQLPLLLINVKHTAGISMLTSSHFQTLEDQNSATVGLEHALLLQLQLLLIRLYTRSSNYAIGLLH
jgi:hypothetical protein